jgi:hypothetical protein
MPLNIDTADKLADIICKKWININKEYEHNLN